MRRRRPISIYLDPDTEKFFREQAARQRISLTTYCEKIMIKGLAVHEGESLVAKIQGAFNLPELDDLRREVLAIRYIVETQAKGENSMPHMIGQDATNYADKALAKRRVAKEKEGKTP